MLIICAAAINIIINTVIIAADAGLFRFVFRARERMRYKTLLDCFRLIRYGKNTLGQNAGVVRTGITNAD